MSVAAVRLRTSGAPVACSTKYSCCLYGTEIGTGLSHERKTQAEVFQKDRDREGTGAGSVTWCLGKRMGCRVWCKHLLRGQMVGGR